MREFKATPAQAAAIQSRGSALLVSAGAGSGKTKVLTERLMAWLCDPEETADLDSFLVITFTRAAAGELKGRIMEELAALAADPGNRRLRRQSALCRRAQIGTIHSFCAEVVRENCHLLSLPPAFTVLDEERAESIRSAVLARILDRRYERIGEDPAFRALTDTVGAGRDDRLMEGAVLELHEKLRSQPWPEQWADEQRRALAAEGVTDAADTVWGRELMDAAKRDCVCWAQAFETALSEIRSGGGEIEKAYAPSFTATAEALRDFARALGGD